MNTCSPGCMCVVFLATLLEADDEATKIHRFATLTYQPTRALVSLSTR